MKYEGIMKNNGTIINSDDSLSFAHLSVFNSEDDMLEFAKWFFIHADDELRYDFTEWFFSGNYVPYHTEN